ncbi:TPA: hypothetical protein HA239_05330 [Candidatus Woesearchaeota archaeon]|nr:hypothetical protein QT06_C0001G0274 [archaeon GW2011_AR15]MBS3103928.1 hypothetical protein [Candidatus Woesearchaeota archaeon]HIH41804.1 hypothetical protein [Candidatus Woesearchaeota archaeon]
MKNSNEYGELLEPYFKEGSLPPDVKIFRTKTGGLNNNLFLKSENDPEIYVLRTPLETALRKETEDHIFQEYTSIGLKNGGWRFRKIPEQAEDIGCWISLGFPVVLPISHTESSMLYPLLSAPTYKDSLMAGDLSANSALLDNYFSVIMDAHKKNVVFGDRWGPNEFVSDKGILLHDFDTKLLSEDRKDFELSQIIYYSVHNAVSCRGEVVQFIKKLLDDRKASQEYNLDIVSQFLAGHISFFRGMPDGGIEEEISSLIDSL